MFTSLFAFLALAIFSRTSALVASRSNVHLAVSPNCGTLSGSPADVNAGIGALNTYKNIVSFGDTYTYGGVSDGSPLKPAVVVPPDPRAGGRMSNGPVWVENLATRAGATLKDYAGNGAVIDATQYPGATFNGVNDYLNQINLFATQPTKYDPNTTLYTIFFGISDYSRGGDMSIAAQNLVYGILKLYSSPVFARNILVVDDYGRGTKSPAGEAFKQQVFTGLNSARNLLGLNVAFVDFANIWNGVLGSTPGYKAFGYTNPGACLVNGDTTDGACSDPDHSFYWIPGVPSQATHLIMADYVEQALVKCGA